MLMDRVSRVMLKAQAGTQCTRPGRRMAADAKATSAVWPAVPMTAEKYRKSPYPGASSPANSSPPAAPRVRFR
jgi:hypothetical protein